MTVDVHSRPAAEDRSVAHLPTATDIDELVARVRPLHDHVLVRLEETAKMVGLIHIPDNAKSRDPRWAVVVRVGPGKLTPSGEREAPGFGPGDRVLLGPDPGWELAGGHRMLRVGAVMAVESRVADA